IIPPWCMLFAYSPSAIRIARGCESGLTLLWRFAGRDRTDHRTPVSYFRGASSIWISSARFFIVGAKFFGNRGRFHEAVAYLPCPGPGPGPGAARAGACRRGASAARGQGDLCVRARGDHVAAADAAPQAVARRRGEELAARRLRA